MNYKTIVFKRLIKFDEGRIKKLKEKYEKEKDSKYLEKIKKFEEHIEQQRKNIKRFQL